MERLDRLLVIKGYAKSRTQAQSLIDKGAMQAKIGGVWTVLNKASQKLPLEIELALDETAIPRFVSRAGEKLDGALNLMVSKGLLTEQLPLLKDYRCLDIGQSTGGFTDCLLQNGVESVLGLDVGKNQLEESLRENPKVTCLEGVNARHLSDIDLGVHATYKFHMVVMDVSFISQTLIIPQLPTLMLPQAWFVSLVKPQFEVGKDGIGKGGIVKDQSLYKDVEQKIKTTLLEVGFKPIDYFDSPILGGDGNKEFFVVARKESL